MPNWCRCELEVVGPEGRVREFLAFARGDDGGQPSVLDFNRFVPYPREWEELDAAFEAALNVWMEGGGAGEPPVSAYTRWGGAWCAAHWGTYANASEVSCDGPAGRDGGCVASVWFKTPWSPPGPVVAKASSLFPDLEFALHYFEPLGDFAGCYRCAGGVGADERWRCEHVIAG